MKKLLVILMLVVAGSAVYASPARLIDVDLSYDKGLSVATIHVDGVVRFRHETVEAKEGKSFRVLVDLLQAEHHLAQKDFAVLPKCVVKQIRTSQYSITPEQVARIVFDLSAETVYRVESDNNSIRLYFTDKNVGRFDRWQASVVASPKKKFSRPKIYQPKVAAVSPAAPAKSVGTINKTIENDRQLSLAGKSPANANTKAKPVSVKKSGPTVKASTEPYGPEFDPAWLTAELPQPRVESEKMTKATPKKVEVATKKSASEPVAKVTPQKPKPAKKTIKAQPVVAKADKPVPTKKAAPKVVAKADKPVPTKKVAPKKTKVAKQQPAKETKKTVAVAPAKGSAPDKSQARPTSRFRRRATGSNKIKGTMVAEFPKRLVIKYRAKSRRDPFATLINEARTHNDLIERQVPNVEGLKLVGIIQGDGGENSALFEDNDNMGYILKAGDKVQKGYVLRVESNRVYFQIFEYGWSRTVALRIDG